MSEKKGTTPTGDSDVKRARQAEADDWSDSDSSGNANGTSQSGKPDSSSRVSLRKEKKSAREKARRQRENALFDELANMCGVPPETRDKSSVLKAVIKRVEELKARGGNPAAMFMNGQFGALSATSSVSSMASNDGSKSGIATGFAQALGQGSLDELLFASRTWAGVPSGASQYFQAQASYPPPPPPPPSTTMQSGSGQFKMASTAPGLSFSTLGNPLLQTGLHHDPPSLGVALPAFQPPSPAMSNTGHSILTVPSLNMMTGGYGITPPRLHSPLTAEAGKGQPSYATASGSSEASYDATS